MYLNLNCVLNWIIWNRTDDLYEMDLELNNLHRLIYHKPETTKPNQLQSLFCIHFRIDTLWKVLNLLISQL